MLVQDKRHAGEFNFPADAFQILRELWEGTRAAHMTYNTKTTILSRRDHWGL